MTSSAMFFESWAGVARVAALGSAAYLTLVVGLRLSGKRTLAKLNAFDLVVTVALGSTLATIILSEDVSFVEGAMALTLLIVAQLVVAWLCVRSRVVRRAAKSEPTMLLRDGVLLPDAMARQRVTPEEVRQAVRSSGRGGLGEVAAVVLETDGTLSVIAGSQLGDARALEDVRDPDARR